MFPGSDNDPVNLRKIATKSQLIKLQLTDQFTDSTSVLFSVCKIDLLDWGGKQKVKKEEIIPDSGISQNFIANVLVKAMVLINIQKLCLNNNIQIIKSKLLQFY